MITICSGSLYIYIHIILHSIELLICSLIIKRVCIRSTYIYSQNKLGTQIGTQERGIQEFSIVVDEKRKGRTLQLS